MEISRKISAKCYLYQNKVFKDNQKICFLECIIMLCCINDKLLKV